MNVPNSLKERLESIKVTQALIYNTDPVFLDEFLGKPSEFEKHLKGYHTLPHHIITHEGFHIFTQFSKWFGIPNYDWPSWDKQPDRDAVIRLCYQAPAVKGIYLKEHKNLLSTFKLIFIFGRPDLGRLAGKEFLRLRESRYLLLVDTKVPTAHNSAGISCPQAEAIMELEEGLADFAGNGTRYLLGEISPNQIAEGLAVPRDSTFYDFGFLQMMAIYGLRMGEISTITSRIAKSQNWSGSIGKEFSDAIQ